MKQAAQALAASQAQGQEGQPPRGEPTNQPSQGKQKGSVAAASKESSTSHNGADHENQELANGAYNQKTVPRKRKSQMAPAPVTPRPGRQFKEEPWFADYCRNFANRCTTKSQRRARTDVEQLSVFFENVD